jgi:tripartite-type tricarboxylate transporter receptor subunit TctC
MKSVSCLVTTFALVALLAFGVSSPSAAQTSSTIRFIYPLAAGGSGDGLTRLLADRMRAEHGLTVVVENRAGGASRIGLLAVKTAPPDGATLLLTQMAPMTLFPHAHKSLDYDPVKDFAPIAQAATFEFGVAVNAGVPVKAPAELLAWLKANPDKAMFGGPGSGGLPHFFGLLLGRAAGVEMTHVPYKGTANGITDLLSGQVPMMVALASDLAPLHKDGRIRVIATTDKERFANLPDVPTFKESGIDIVGTGWFGVYAPANTPPIVVDRLNRMIVSILQSPTVKDRITSLGLKPTGSSPAELAAIQQADLEKWGPVIKASGFSFD